VTVVKRVGGYSPYEDEIGYSRALVTDTGRVLVCGTTSAVDGVVRHPGDAEAQARQAIETIGRALRDAGTSLEHVVLTRIYVTSPDHCEAAGRAHLEAFDAVRPVATMLVVSGLIHPDMLVEIEVEATLP
jgi:enamine deaminase RidA (YjgF/YER057c/UK114 family)